MKKKLMLLLTLLSLALMPVATMASGDEHGAAGGHEMAEHGKGHEMGEHAMSGHEMAEHAQMIMLGDKVVDGVKASVHLNDVKAAMAKMGMKETHHFMVMFQEDASGKALEAGTVALKIKGPDKVESAPVSLMGMGGHFGADITLAAPGQYTFTLGTKLPDGKTRQFEYSYDLK